MEREQGGRRMRERVRARARDIETEREGERDKVSEEAAAMEGAEACNRGNMCGGCQADFNWINHSDGVWLRGAILAGHAGDEAQLIT